MTLLEWNSLERDPVRQEILSPFIERQIEVSLANAVTEIPGPELVFEAETGAEPEAELQYQVELSFNGPKFLAFFFVPILAFHGFGLLWQHRRN